jgi:hypothetical protein
MCGELCVCDHFEATEVEKELESKMILQDVKRAGSVGKLLSTPTKENTSAAAYSRVNCDFRNLSERFGHKSKDYARQFAHIYAVRLTKMRELLTRRIRKKWGKVCSITLRLYRHCCSLWSK